MSNHSIYTDALKKYCAASERCTREVEYKMRELKVPEKEREAILSELRKEGFLDDLRFAKAFSRGKFHQNHWGRVKIRYELAARGIPETIIRQGLDDIDEDEYMDMIRQVLQKKISETKGEKKLNIRSKLVNFAMGKGYESSLILDVLKEMKI